jgi:hypothetical protein
LGKIYEFSSLYEKKKKKKKKKTFCQIKRNCPMDQAKAGLIQCEKQEGDFKV